MRRTKILMSAKMTSNQSGRCPMLVEVLFPSFGISLLWALAAPRLRTRVLSPRKICLLLVRTWVNLIFF